MNNCSRIQTISVVGLGYVGLPIAVAFGKHVEVVGYDIDEGRRLLEGMASTHPKKCRPHKLNPRR